MKAFNKNKIKKAITSSKAFTLVEVNIAMGVFAVSLLSIFAVMASGISSLEQSKLDTVSSNIARRVFTDLREPGLHNRDGDENIGSTVFRSQKIVFPGLIAYNADHPENTINLFFDAQGEFVYIDPDNAKTEVQADVNILYHVKVSGYPYNNVPVADADEGRNTPTKIIVNVQSPAIATAGEDNDSKAFNLNKTYVGIVRPR